MNIITLSLKQGMDEVPKTRLIYKTWYCMQIADSTIYISAVSRVSFIHRINWREDLWFSN